MGKVKDYLFGSTDTQVVTETRDTQQGQSQETLPPSRTAFDVNVRSALSISSVYRAISILTTYAQQLCLNTYRGEDSIPNSGLIANPDYLSHRAEWVRDTVFNLAAYGNAYWQVKIANDGTVSRLVSLRPDAMNIVRQNDGTLVYNYSGYTQSLQLYPYTAYSPADATVVHLKLNNIPYNFYYGQGPLQACPREVRGLLQLREFADKWFDNSGVPTGLLTTKNILDPEMAKAFKEQWYKTLEAGGLQVLGNDLNYQNIELNPAEAQYLELQNAAVAQVARMFGIPANLMLAPLDGSSDTYTNLQWENQKFVTTTLMQYLLPIETALSDFVPRTQVVKFDLSELLRADDGTRIKNYVTLINAGVLAPEEVRAFEGYGDKNPDYTYITPTAELAPAAEKE